MPVPPEEKATPEWQAKNAAGKTFKAARASWRDAKNRKNQIKAQIEAGGLTEADERALRDELRGVKERLPTLTKARRSTKATWQGLKDRYRTPPVSKGP
jgi:5-bromo-4-chloroindolyl phosphate hydrolysis protein